LQPSTEGGRGGVEKFRKKGIRPDFLSWGNPAMWRQAVLIFATPYPPLIHCQLLTTSAAAPVRSNQSRAKSHITARGDCPLPAGSLLLLHPSPVLQLRRCRCLFGWVLSHPIPRAAQRGRSEGRCNCVRDSLHLPHGLNPFDCAAGAAQLIPFAQHSHQMPQREAADVC